MAQQRVFQPEPVEPPLRPLPADQPARFILLEREVEQEYRPQMWETLQRKVNTVAEEAGATIPECPRCGQPMIYHDTRPVSRLAHWGRLQASPSRYRCSPCKQERRPLLDLPGVEPGRICGSSARRLGLLAAVAPYELAARLAQLLLGVTIGAMGVWRVAQRLGRAAASHSEALSQYHADSRSEGASVDNAPPAVVLGIDGCALGMQVRTRRRRRVGAEPLPALPVIEQGHFREVKTGVLLLPRERVETSPGRRSVVRRFRVTCLGGADEIFRCLYAQVRELGWVGPHTVVVIVGDGAEWIWNRAAMFLHRCEILDFRHALEHAWTFARLRYGEGSAQAGQWVHQIAEDLRAGKVQEVIARLKRLRPKTPELRQSLQSLIRYYSENAGRMRYDEYLQLGYGIGSGAVESAHKQVVHARLRQAGMRWSESGARRLLALRLLLLNDNWELLDRMRMVSLAWLFTSPGCSPRTCIDLGAAMRHARAMARRSPTEMPVNLRARLEAARLDLPALFRALDRMDLSPAEIPQRFIRQLFELDADYVEALWALDQPSASLDLRAMLRDTLVALEQLPEACVRFRKNLPRRAHPTLAQLEIALRNALDPAQAYNMVPGRSPQNG